MLFERRCYTFKPGEIGRFWKYQERWNTPRHIPQLLARNVGYFETVAGPAEQVVMVYRYDSFEDWQSRFFSGIDEERTNYLVAGRALMLAQENMFLKVCPVDALNPVWGEGRDWLPGEPRFPVARSEAACLVEDVTDFRPGALPAYWNAFREYLAADERALRNLVGTFVAFVGQQHRVIQYHWSEDREAALAARDDLRRAPAWTRFTEQYRDNVVHSQTRLLRTARVAWMRNLFEPMMPPEGGNDVEPH
ncbi:hypothetical protein SM0020_26446 [Sinorhizobium meliloti CCNWSX0020]|uniref:NIPSNAP domain-containing protein n=1 Tax=Sinorhizobium meliloti CCNWSX0020 TaxID=1107881 RepID=H0G711_RHIML|nr:NIPSNAP family protein [Sinorhizobium meliloti]EHK74913.1 hypothetical protein SM0020_26446 [Sinorhizobium meliloti CCNWSX0020]